MTEIIFLEVVFLILTISSYIILDCVALPPGLFIFKMTPLHKSLSTAFSINGRIFFTLTGPPAAITPLISIMAVCGVVNLELDIEAKYMKSNTVDKNNILPISLYLLSDLFYD